jgi:hypothetical protein
MKNFLIRFTLFALLLLTLSWLADKLISSALRRSKQLDYGVWNDLLEGKVNADIIIHGSSRAWVQVNPARFEDVFKRKTYNLGIDAYGFHMQYCRHLELLQHNTLPSTIIHVLDYSIFDKADSLYSPQQFFPYLNDSLIAAFTSSYKGIDWFDRTLPFLRYVGETATLRHAAKILLRPDSNTPDKINGFQAQHLSWNNDLQNARNKLKDSYYEPVDSTIVNLFKKYIEECRAKKIQLILVYPPEYIEGQDFVRNRRDILKLFENIASQYELPYLDYSHHPICNDRQYFYNTEHLNAAGSDLFTDIFINDIKTLLVSNTRP